MSICAYHELHELTTNQRALIFQLYLHAFLIRFMTAQKMKFPINDFFSKCDQIRRKLRIWSHLLKKSLMENFVQCLNVIVVLVVKKNDQ